MSVRKLIVLGTSSQIPTRQRNQTGFILRWDNEGFLIDPGEGAQRQMTRFGVAASSITKILISHFHGDHCLGLPGVIQRLSLDQIGHVIHVFYPASGQVYFERLLHPVIYREFAEICPHPVSTPGDIFENAQFIITALPLKHTVDVLGYRIREKDGRTLQPKKLAAAGIERADINKLIKEGKLETTNRTVRLSEVSAPKPGQIAAVIMDTAPCANAYKLADAADMLICEATYLDSEKELAKKYNHLTASQAARIAKESRAKRLTLSHFSQRYQSTDNFVAEAGAIHADVIAANDGDEIEFPHVKRKLE